MAKRKRKSRLLKALRFFYKRSRKTLKKRRRKGRFSKLRTNHSSNTNNRLQNNLIQNKRALFVADKNFSIVNNPDSTISFFNDISHKFEKLVPVHLDISNVESLTIDALLYLLAIIDRMKSQNMPVYIQGNLPSHSETKDMFSKSGFLRFVNSSIKTIERTSNCVQIYDGYDADSDIARKLCIFTIDSFNISRTKTKQLYDIVMEIIINTKQHAYSGKSKLPKWYAYAWFDQAASEITFSILDTGNGIPNTIRKDWSERLNQVVSRLPLVSSRDAELLSSVLNGDFRTKTAAKNRGKGIPRIRSYFAEGFISDLTIVSNNGFVSLSNNNSFELKLPLKGTLYSWRIKHVN